MPDLLELSACGESKEHATMDGMDTHFTISGRTNHLSLDILSSVLQWSYSRWHPLLPVHIVHDIIHVSG
jgi:hypothetical protein